MATKNAPVLLKEKNFLQTFAEAFSKGDIFTKLSLLVWGIGYLGHKQII